MPSKMVFLLCENFENIKDVSLKVPDTSFIRAYLTLLTFGSSKRTSPEGKQSNENYL